MSLLKNLQTTNEISNEKDVLFGSRVVDSDLYPATVSLAYVKTADSGAVAIELVIKTTEGGKDIRNTLWVQSGRDKGLKNYYEKDGQKNYLPGFLLAESLALLTVGKSLSELDTEEKVIKAYDPTAKAEVPTKVQMITELLGQPILAGVLKLVVDKTKKQDDGSYAATGETREENEIDKFFRAKDRMTTAEIRAQAEAAVFVDQWLAKNKGQVVIKAKGAGAAGKAGAPGRPQAGTFGKGPAANSPAAAQGKTSLFA